MHYIRNNACKGIKVEQVLDAVGISARIWKNASKRRSGETIHGDPQRKTGKGAQPAGVHQLSINEISQMCGYPSLQYFYSVFKKEYDVTPKEYRDRHSEVML
jgi:LacI family transcriptional regulator